MCTINQLIAPKFDGKVAKLLEAENCYSDDNNMKWTFFCTAHRKFVHTTNNVFSYSTMAPILLSYQAKYFHDAIIACHWSVLSERQVS